MFLSKTVKKSYQASAWERVFGGDLWRLRNLMRRLVSVLFALIPVKTWRHQARETLDRWIIRFNRRKIAHFIEQYPPVKGELETVARLAANRACHQHRRKTLITLNRLFLSLVWHRSNGWALPTLLLCVIQHLSPPVQQRRT